MAQANTAIKPKKRAVVLDTAALIAGTDSLFALGGLVDAENQQYVEAPEPHEQVTFYTTPDVVREVRDKRARARLALLRDMIVVRPPSSEALASTISFAKATGDFAVLSLTDLRVIALCRMLEIERDGGSCLRGEPQQQSFSQIRIGKPMSFAEIEKIEREAELEEMERQKLHEQNGGWTTVNYSSSHQRHKGNPTETKVLPKDVIQIESNGITCEVSRPDLPTIIESTASLSVADSETKSTPEGETKSMPDGETKSMPEGETKLTPEGETKYPNLDNVSFAGDEEDDDEGWINLDNLEENLAHDAKVVAPTKEEEERVGCVTTDFAMQNTMLQMGLKILTVDGRRSVSKIRHFALRCSACGLVTRELGKKFCDACGSFAMHRVAFKVGKNGVARAFVNPKKRLNTRGTKYPIPKTRGGRHNNDLILRADEIDDRKQRHIQKRLERQNVDVLDPTTFYNAGARFNPNEKPMVIGYGRRNPNEVRRKTKKKK